MHRCAPCLVLLCAFAGCEQPTPNSPAVPIGEFPKWGQDFSKPQANPAGSLLSPGGTADPTPPEKDGAPGPDAPPAGKDVPLPSTDDDGDGQWGGGDPATGKGVWLAMCARCHGAAGEGGTVPATGSVPALSDPAKQAQLTDKQIASTVAHGKGAMPPFMGELDKAQIDGVIAYIRTLKK